MRLPRSKCEIQFALLCAGEYWRRLNGLRLYAGPVAAICVEPDVVLRAHSQAQWPIRVELDVLRHVTLPSFKTLRRRVEQPRSFSLLTFHLASCSVANPLCSRLFADRRAVVAWFVSPFGFSAYRPRDSNLRSIFTCVGPRSRISTCGRYRVGPGSRIFTCGRYRVGPRTRISFA